METKDKLYYYHNDINGAPLRLTDEQGNIVWNAHYDIFGKIDKISKNEIDNPIRMQGQYEDEETGLYYNRYRYYDPVISAYVSQDPLGLGAGENVYSYTLNSFGWIDPLGLSCKKSGNSSGKENFENNSTKNNGNWNMDEGGSNINGRNYSKHALERMAPDTPQVRAELNTRASNKAKMLGLEPGTKKYSDFMKKEVDPRGIPPMVVEDTIINGNTKMGNKPFTWEHSLENVKAITNEFGDVITVIPQ